jgi:hypothetical protein
MKNSYSASSQMSKQEDWVSSQQMEINCNHGSSQGILAYRAGTRAPPAGMHETIKKKIYVLCMYLSSKHV